MIIQTGKFIKVDEVKIGDVVSILDAGVIRDNDKFTVKKKDADGNEISVPKKDYIFKINHKGAEKIISMNKMSRDNLAAGYGVDTEGWIGQKASIDLCLFSNGKKGIVLTPINAVNHEEEPKEDEPPF